MRATDIRPEALEFARLGRVAEDWHIRSRSPAEIVALLDAVGPWNDFEPAVVSECLAPLLRRLEAVTVGLEGSPVVLAHIPMWRHAAMSGGLPLRIPSAEREALAAMVRDALRAALADECHAVMVADELAHVRAWWD